MIKREELLEKSITNLRKEKMTAQFEAEKALSQKDHELANIMEEKQKREKQLQDQITQLKNETKAYSSDYDDLMNNHSLVVEGLKNELSKARKLRDDTNTSIKQDMEDMKKDHDENIAFYKEEVESLRSQLRSSKQKAESDKKEHMLEISKYERQLEESYHEKNDALASLAHCRKDLECIKTERGKDLHFLESELETTYASKVEMERELDDTRRQLKNALRSLDEMALDGGNMRTDLEAIMNEFRGEKHHFQKELSMLKNQNKEQKDIINTISIEKKTYEKSCEELQTSVKMMEEQLNDYKKQNEGDATGKEVLMLEIKYLKNRLEKAGSTESNHHCSASSDGSELSDHNNAIVDRLQTEKIQIEKQLESHKKTLEQLRISERGKSAELSKAQQTIQILKSKERYLESRVDSLANQIARTVQDYENRLGEVRESSCNY